MKNEAKEEGPIRQCLYWLIDRMGDAHDWILHLNDTYEFYLSDKQLHFIVMGALGLIIYGIARSGLGWLSRKSPNALGWAYSLTAMLAITLAIEIAQKATGTGSMEYMDIAMGMWGVIAVMLAYTVLAWMLRKLKKNGH